MKRLFIAFLAIVCLSSFSIGKTLKTGTKTSVKQAPAAAPQPKRVKGGISKTPYIGAMIVDADTGAVLFEDHADAPCYPASTLKLMTLLVIQEKIEAGQVKLTDMVNVSVAAAKTGGSQVYLDPRETFSVEELLYAMMIQSANDAAVALAEHVGGSKEGFVALMNAEAQRIGMKNSRFASVHGLPPSAGQRNDVSSARDMTLLACELCRHPAIFAYTSTVHRPFRANTPKPFDMRTHNPFLKEGAAGCDGLKTGYTATAGWSILVTAKRNGRRVIVTVMGSDGRKMRDAKAHELLNKAFSLLPPLPAPPPPAAAKP